MHILAIVCFAGALTTAIFAVVIQRCDMTRDRGSTMGGQMTTGAIWSLTSLFCAVGSLVFVRWYFSILVYVGVFILSFLIRILIERIPKKS
jgi:hypothetical protein